MTDRRIVQVDTTDMSSLTQQPHTDDNFQRSIDPVTQDTPGTTYTCDWSKWFGYYVKVPELQAVIEKKAMWTVGRGFKASKKVTAVLNKIKGTGKDTFNTIMANLVRTYTIGGDAYAEIIRDRAGRLINLKPINPGSMEVHSNERGIITGYEQRISLDERTGEKQTIKFKPKEIFHLAWNRMGDEVHGRSTIEKIERIILMRNEAMEDLKVVFHRYVKPLIVIQADTDDDTEIKALKAKIDKAVNNMENMIIPQGTMTMERMSIPQYSTLDPLPWIKVLQEFFILSEGVPEVILGYGRDTTEASSKILYLAFQQLIEFNQLWLEEQIKSQLSLELEFNFPADIAPELAVDIRKERNMNTLETKGKSDVRPTAG